MSDQIGVIENPDKSIKLVIPAEGFTVQFNFDRMGEQGVVLDRSALPTPNAFRNAWEYDSVNQTIVINLTKAKEMVRTANEASTAKALNALQPALEAAIDDDNVVAEQAVRDNRRTLRNALSAKLLQIDSATTAQELVDLMP